MELLSPAGSYSALVGAINAGCDAVYLGGNKFGARAYAENFSLEEIIKAIEYAHLFNVKIYLTVNTLIKEREFKDCLDYIKPLYEAGLDGCIVQDLGLIKVFSEVFPNMECHISTQGFVTGIEAVKFYKSLGAKRVVLARELSLKEIKEIKSSVDIEIETFIHGAMCYSYSGECLFSSCLGGRSGNRGRCAGPCRQPYSFVENKKVYKENYLLSMKDQCTLDILPKLIEAGIDSLKIEGRMKKPEYTAYVTSVYRKYIDLYNKNPKEYQVSKKDFEDLKHIYLRSEIGNGYYFKNNGKDMISLKNPGYNGNDEYLMEKVRKDYLSKGKKLKVNIYSKASKEGEFSLTVNCGEEYVTISKNIVSPAQNRPTENSEIIKQLNKLGDTNFEAENVFSECDENIFIPIKFLNEIRREAILHLQSQILSKYKNREKLNLETNIVKRKQYSIENPLVFVHTIEQYKIISSFNRKINPIIPFELFSKEKEDFKNAFLALPDVARNKDHEYLEKAIKAVLNKMALGLFVRNFEELGYLISKNYDGPLIFSHDIYGFNKEAVNEINCLCDAFILPLELNKHEIKEVYNEKGYIFAYGKMPLMHTANCILKTQNDCKKGQGDTFYYIKDRTGVNFPFYRNCDVCSNTIFNSIPTCLYSELNNGFFDINHIFLFLSDEDSKETLKVLSLFFEGKGNVPKDITKAYYNRGVE